MLLSFDRLRIEGSKLFQSQDLMIESAPGSSLSLKHGFLSPNSVGMCSNTSCRTQFPPTTWCSRCFRVRDSAQTKYHTGHSGLPRIR